jgi:hypothetical protein
MLSLYNSAEVCGVNITANFGRLARRVTACRRVMLPGALQESTLQSSSALLIHKA